MGTEALTGGWRNPRGSEYEPPFLSAEGFLGLKRKSTVEKRRRVGSVRGEKKPGINIVGWFYRETYLSAFNIGESVGHAPLESTDWFWLRLLLYTLCGVRVKRETGMWVMEMLAVQRENVGKKEL